MELIRAYRKDRELLQDIEDHTADDKQVSLWWLGQSGYLVTWKGKRILIDPYLSDSLSVKYLHTNRPHTRMSERVLDPALLRDIDIVTSSHNHTDHLDGETLIPLIRNNPDIAMVIPEANRTFVCDRIGMPLSFPIGLNDGVTIEVKGVGFTGIPAAHNEIERDGAGQCLYMGYVMRIGGINIYHSGDTVFYKGMEDILAPLEIDVALLPINGNDPARGVAGNLDCTEAAELGKRIGAALTIPCHYDMFRFNTADPNDFARAAEAERVPYRILRLGERMSIRPGRKV